MELSHFLVGRYRAAAPADWKKKSDYLLSLWKPDQARVLSACGLRRPLEVREIDAFLSSKAQQQGPEWVDSLEFPTADGGWSTLSYRPIGPGMDELRGQARDMVATLGCEEWEAVAFLLADAPLVLPWIDVEWAWGRTGHRFHVHVGTADATAEDVRAAYYEALKQATGISSPRAKNADSVLLVVEDLKGWRDGLTWKQRHNRWKGFAEEIGATKYETVESYRQNVGRVMREVPWLQQARLEVEE